MESVKWPKYLIACRSCDFLISKDTWILKIINLPVHFPLKWEIRMNLVKTITHCLNSFMDVSLCMISCISLL